MNDLISRQAAIDAIENAFDRETILNRFVRKIAISAVRLLPSAEPEKVCIANITLSEEQVREAVEKAKSEIVQVFPSTQPEQQWIPVSERLPEEPFGCLVTVWDTDPITMDEFENILPYFVGWDGEQWNDDEGKQCPFEVIAWMPLPEPYREDIE